MTDLETLERLLRFFSMKEHRGGSSSLQSKHFKYPPSGIDGSIQATPELSSYLWEQCRALASSHPGMFRFSGDDFHFCDDPQKLLGSHCLQQFETPVAELLRPTKSAHKGRGPLAGGGRWEVLLPMECVYKSHAPEKPSMSDISWLKTGLNKFFRIGHRNVTRRELQAFAECELESLRPTLERWSRENWLTFDPDFASADQYSLVVTMLQYIDNQQPHS